MRRRQRLERLERHVAGTALACHCPGCFHRQGRIAMVIARPDGSTATSDRPAPCSLCGQVPEQILTIVERIVDRSSLAGGAERDDSPQREE